MAVSEGKTSMNRLLESRWVSLVARMVLGVTFIYSALPKILDPPGFAQMIWNYRILPGLLVNPLAILLPWVELLAGLALLSGFLRKGAALLVMAMLIVFVIAIAADLARGIPIDCGCFSINGEPRTPEELFAGMKLDLLRDAGLLALASQVLFSRIPGAKS